MNNYKPIRLILLLALLINFLSCSIEPVPLEYGADQCKACKMMIVDQRFGAELITQKGKVYKYDALECLLEAIQKEGEDKFRYVLTVDFENPTNLMDAKSSYYLISASLPSPMGANLSSYVSKGRALASQAKNSGQVYDWEGLNKVISH